LFTREKRLLLLRISELEEDYQHLISQPSALHNEADMLGKIKRLEEDNFRLTQLYNAGVHKIEYYMSLLNSQVLLC